MKIIDDSHWKCKYGKRAAEFPDDVVPVGGLCSKVPPPQSRVVPIVRGSKISAWVNYQTPYKKVSIVYQTSMDSLL